MGEDSARARGVDRSHRTGATVRRQSGGSAYPANGAGSRGTTSRTLSGIGLEQLDSGASALLTWRRPRRGRGGAPVTQGRGPALVWFCGLAQPGSLEAWVGILGDLCKNVEAMIHAHLPSPPAVPGMSL